MNMIVLAAPIKFQGQIGQLVDGKDAWSMGHIQFDYLKQNMRHEHRHQLENYDFPTELIKIEVINGTLCAVAIGKKKL
jgi:hypothetical protein